MSPLPGRRKCTQRPNRIPIQNCQPKLPHTSYDWESPAAQKHNTRAKAQLTTTANPTSTTTVPEFPTLAILPLFVCVLIHCNQAQASKDDLVERRIFYK